jgi:ribosomal protein S20
VILKKFNFAAELGLRTLYKEVKMLIKGEKREENVRNNIEECQSDCSKKTSCRRIKANTAERIMNSKDKIEWSIYTIR